MKTTQTQLQAAVDSFLYRYDWLTGGTRTETLAQAPQGIKDLEELAAKVATLAANPNKVAAANAHLMEYALELVPAKVERYRNAYLPEAVAAPVEAFTEVVVVEAAKTPGEVIPFPGSPRTDNDTAFAWGGAWKAEDAATPAPVAPALLTIKKGEFIANAALMVARDVWTLADFELSEEFRKDRAEELIAACELVIMSIRANFPK